MGDLSAAQTRYDCPQQYELCAGSAHGFGRAVHRRGFHTPARTHGTGPDRSTRGSQPVIVALMTELLGPRRGDRVLEIGTGSGYQAAVLSCLVKQVYTIEIIEPLAKAARARLESLGYRNVAMRAGDGYRGWPEAAPFDRVILTSAPPEVPQALIDELKPSGRLVAPVGRFNQDLVVLDKDAAGRTKQRSVIPVRFVPMVPGKCLCAMCPIPTAQWCAGP